MRIEYIDVPESLQPILNQRLGAFTHCFPSWCEHLSVYWQKQASDDTILSCNPRHEYRSMSITVYPLFFETHDWQNAVLHEIQHGLLRPLIAKIERIVDRFVKDEQINEYIHDELTETEEAVCEDLTIFAQKLCRCTSLSVKNVGTKRKN